MVLFGQDLPRSTIGMPGHFFAKGQMLSNWNERHASRTCIEHRTQPPDMDPRIVCQFWMEARSKDVSLSDSNNVAGLFVQLGRVNFLDKSSGTAWKRCQGLDRPRSLSLRGIFRRGDDCLIPNRFFLLLSACWW